MNIKNISSTQFAGIRNIDISLADGLNVIYGKNESGKSTLVNLLSRILFQNSKLDRRSDKDFLELYFPCIKKTALLEVILQTANSYSQQKPERIHFQKTGAAIHFASSLLLMALFATKTRSMKF